MNIFNNITVRVVALDCDTPAFCSTVATPDSIGKALASLVGKTRVAMIAGNTAPLGRLDCVIGNSEYGLIILSNAHYSDNQFENAKYVEVALTKNGRLLVGENGDAETFIFNHINYHDLITLCNQFESMKIIRLSFLVYSLYRLSYSCSDKEAADWIIHHSQYLNGKT